MYQIHSHCFQCDRPIWYFPLEFCHISLNTQDSEMKVHGSDNNPIIVSVPLILCGRWSLESIIITSDTDLTSNCP